MTTGQADIDSALDGEILESLDLDAALDRAADLGLDLEGVMQADPQDEGQAGARSYDFNRRHSISRRFSQNLRNIAELFSRSATVNLTSMLRANVAVDFQGIVLRSYNEYRKALARTACLAAVTLHPLAGQSLINLDLNLCFAILKRLMGGRPDSEEKVRGFTEIERGIISHFIGRLLGMLRTSAAKLVELNPELAALENNPEYIAGIPDGETLAVMRFRLRLETVEAGLDIAFPLSAFNPVRDVFDPEEQREMRSSREQQQDRSQIMDLVQRTTSELVVRLGERSMSLDEVLALREGDVVNLGQGVNSPLAVLVEDQEVFLGEAGRVGKNRAVKLVRKIERE